MGGGKGRGEGREGARLLGGEVVPLRGLLEQVDFVEVSEVHPSERLLETSERAAVHRSSEEDAAVEAVRAHAWMCGRRGGGGRWWGVGCEGV